MRPAHLVAMFPLWLLVACDSQPQGPSAQDLEAKAKADEKAAEEARIEARRKEREAKEKAEAEAEAAAVAKIEEITVIPEGTKRPKKVADACNQVVEAQKAFMAKYHPDVPEQGLATQLGMLGKQCNEMGNVDIALCQKFALDATTEEIKGRINDYLPACAKKYGTPPG